MRIVLTLILLFTAYACSTVLVQSQSGDLAGRWKIVMTFQDQSQRSLRFEAAESGKGSLLLEARSNWDEPGRPSEAKWMITGQKRVTFYGRVEFPIGNVGREPGILVFKGVFEKEALITGEFAFFPMDQDPTDPNAAPSKTGKFKATRVNSFL